MCVVCVCVCVCVCVICFFVRKLSDLDEDGKLSIGEFCVAVHIVIHRRRGDEIPAVLPAVLWPKSE